MEREVLVASAFTTTGAQGSANDNTSSTSNGAGAFVIVTSVSGTSPTGDIKYNIALIMSLMQI